jgi:endoglucanase
MTPIPCKKVWSRAANPLLQRGIEVVDGKKPPLQPASSKWGRFTLLLVLTLIVPKFMITAKKADAWQGLPMSKLHVSGNQLVNSNGEPVTLSGWFQPTAGYFTYGSSDYYLNFHGNNIHSAVLGYLKDVADKLTDTSPAYGRSHGWNMNLVRICIDTDYLGDVAAGTYNFAGLQAATQNIVIPFIDYART